MKQFVLRSALAVLAFAVMAPIAWAAPAAFNFQTIVYPSDTFTQTLGINNSSTIAGYHNAAANSGFTLTLPGSFTNENFPGSAATQVIGINNTGLTAGFYVDNDGNNHGFTYNGSSFSTVDAPGTAFNQLLGVNDLGVAAGYSSTDPTGATAQRAYITTGGSFLYLDSALPSGAGNNQATGLNNSGWVTGFFLTNSGADSTGFLLAGSTLTQLLYPGSTFTQALGVNNLGEVVGFYIDGSGGMHGFLYNGSSYQSIDDPNGVGTTLINGVNDLGQIVGFYVDASGNTDGFVGTPTPEPGTLLLLGSGLLAGLGLLRRKVLP